MKFIVYVKPEAVVDFSRRLKSNETLHEPVALWLQSRVRIVTQTRGSWTPVILTEEEWFWVKDNFQESIIMKDAEY